MPDGSSSAAPVTSPVQVTATKYLHVNGRIVEVGLGRIHGFSSTKSIRIAMFLCSAADLSIRAHGGFPAHGIEILTQCRCRCETIGRRWRAQLSLGFLEIMLTKSDECRFREDRHRNGRESQMMSIEITPGRFDVVQIRRVL